MSAAWTLMDGSDVAASLANSKVSTKAETRPAVQYPASLAQQRFWVLDKLEPRNPALNVAVRWRIEGDLTAELIEKAFAQIVERHETLRTSFAEIDGEPFQFVQPDVWLRVPSIDLTARPEAEAFAECDRIARAEATTPFDLAIAPLLRVTYVRVRSDVAILLVTAHHIVCDGWSIGLLAREMGAICAALQARGRAELPTLPIAYGDYAAWQKQVVALDGDAPEAAYWKRTLGGLEFFELPTDFPRKPGQGSTGAIQSHLLGRVLTEKLAGVARQKGCTLFMLAYAALVTMLHRCTGATDIAVSTQVAGRDQVETENLVGLFINTLVLRADLAGDPSFAEMLNRARDVVAQALEHEAMPLEKVIEILRLKRSPGQNSVCSVNFVYQRSFIENADHGTFRVVDLPSYSAGALFDLNFFMVERPEGWRLSCEYKTDLFEADNVLRILGRYQRLLEGIVAKPDQRLSEFPLLSEAELRRVLTEWNATDVDYSQDKCIHSLFEAQAAQTPDAIAVVYADEQLTYEELNAKANRLAHHLRRLGVRPDSRVAICVERGLEMVIGVLAILKAGGSYVPLDPGYPAERLAYMLSDSAPIAVLSHTAARPALEKTMAGQSERPPILDLAADATAWADQSSDNPEPGEIGLTPRHLAYVIYTSGSTGQPKGVMIEHWNVVRLFAATEGWFHFGRKDVWTLFHSFAFDFSVWEIWGALFYGGRLVVVPQSTTRSPREFYNLLVRERVTILNQTPSAFSQLIDAQGDSKKEHRLRSVIFGGEALQATTLKPWFHDRRNRHVRMINMYGITETTVHVTYCPVEFADTLLGGSRIGRPIPDLKFYILDKHGAPTPIGVTGEIHVGGGGVARGYLNRPELTAERFLASPFVEGDRLYRTGDLGRFLPDGSIEYLGRNDFQVKIRGFRIELGEIQARLVEHPGVREAVVVAREGAPGDKRLVAYLTARDRRALKDSELRDLVRAKLPEYMVPSAFVVLDRFPLTPNGKIDGRALPRPSHWGEASKAGSSPPADKLEIQLAQIWRDILGVKSIDASSDFFDLGGHSLLAARMLARVETVFGRRIGLSRLFESSGFAAFANVLRSPPQRDFDFRQIVRMGSRHADRKLFAINNTGIFLTLSQRLNEDLSIVALQLFDPLIRIADMPATIEETASRYVRLIRQIQPRGPYLLLGWCSGGTLAFETASQLEAAGEVVSRVFMIDTWIPGYLKRLGWVRSRLADYSYRLRLILLDWDAAWSGQKSLRTFIANRRTLGRFFRRSRITDVKAEPAYAAAQGYDRWLLDHTIAMLEDYRPKQIVAPLTIFRSTSEPTGRFLDPKLGWGGMGRNVDLIPIPGDHFTVFSEPGVPIMAKCIEAATRSDVA